MTQEANTWGVAIAGVDPKRRADKDAVKVALPLEWVLQREGVSLSPDSTGTRLIGRCPFHDDSSENFAVYGEDMAVGGCWACGFSGDLFEAIGRLHALSFSGSLQYAVRLLDEFRADRQWKPGVGKGAKAPKADPADLGQRAAQAHAAAKVDPAAIVRLIDEKRRDDQGWHAVTVDYLVNEWMVGVEGDWTIVVPHLSFMTGDQAWQVRGLKTRSVRGHLYASQGSDLVELYGVHRDRLRPQVVLVEGESDTWTTDLAVGEMADVLGLPSGASAKPRDHWIERLHDRDVILAFDGDNSGRRALLRWHLALRGKARSIRVVPMADGYDLSGCPSIVRALRSAEEVKPSVGAVFPSKDGKHYVRRGGDEDQPITNWAMAPSRELVFDDGSTGYEGRVGDLDAVITAADMASDSAMRRWSQKVKGNWRGTTRDAQDLLGLLEADGPFMARGRATGVVGWHEGNFVWPGGHMGPDYWRYVPPTAAVPMTGLRILDEAWHPDVLHLLLQLHDRAVTAPILAWLGAAPLRSLQETFPFLAVVGSSGSGKTTLTEAFLNSFGWRVNSTLTATTPHAVHSMAGATNGIPVWFDEYRPGAREDSLTALNQVLRDAYDATPSLKGGIGENRQSLTAMPTTAPLIVTGEDAFSETSHVQRAVLVNLPARGQNPDALRALATAPTAGLGHAYLRWLVSSNEQGTLPGFTVDTTLGRVASNMAVLEAGWAMLRQFAAETGGHDLGELDLSHVRRSVAEAAASDPITDALRWAAYSHFYGEQVVWFEGDDVVVKVPDFVREVQRSGQFVLPGGRAAIGKYLDEHWGAAVTTHPVHGRVHRLTGQASRLLED